MISVKVFQNEHGYVGVESAGHAGYAEEGFDIICAAVSVLIVNTVNSIDTLTEDSIICDQRDGYVRFTFQSVCSRESELLMKSLILGLSSIREQYGTQYLDIEFEEV